MLIVVTLTTFAIYYKSLLHPYINEHF